MIQSITIRVIGISLIVLFQSCSSDDNEPPTGELTPPSDLKAYPIYKGIRLAWRHSTTAHYGNFSGYKVTTSDTSHTILESVQTQRYDTDYTIHNLTIGVPYLFSVQSVSATGQLTDSITVQASPDSELALEEFAPPTGLRALSKEESVTLWWSASTDAGASAFSGYRITTKDIGDVVVDTAAVNKTALTYTVYNLINGEDYFFAIRSVNSNGAVSKPVTITWGPTERFISSRVYEYDHGSLRGLQFSTGQAFNFVSGNQQKIDVWIDGHGNSQLMLRSPVHVSSPNPGWRTTGFVQTTALQLDEHVSIPAYTDFAFDSVAISINKLYFGYTQDGHYAKFVITGVGGTSPDRFIEMDIAYNSGYGVWAKKR